MTAVHALYNRSVPIGAILCVIVFGELIMVCVCGSRALTVANFNNICVSVGDVPYEAIYLVWVPLTDYGQLFDILIFQVQVPYLRRRFYYL